MKTISCQNCIVLNHSLTARVGFPTTSDLKNLQSSEITVLDMDYK